MNELTRLLDSGDYERCLEEAAQLLMEGGHDTEEQARIYAAICRSRLELLDYFGAVEAGCQAVALSELGELADLRGFVLPDLGLALCEIRRYEEALATFRRYSLELCAYSGARCREGTALQREGGTCYRSGATDEALSRYRQALAWFERYGDGASAVACTRAILRIFLDQGQLGPAIPLSREGDAYAQSHPLDRQFLAAHLLDRALFHLAAGRYEASIQEAFRALEAAEDLLQQTRAHLILAQNALAKENPREALSFALAARVSAIDGKLYDLEFEASDILHRVLQKRGADLIRHLENDFYEQKVDIYRYVSERVVKRIVQEQE